MTLIRISIVFFILININEVFSDEFELLLENYFGQRSSISTNPIDLSQIQYQYEYYSNNPLDINNSSLKRLKELPLVSEDLLKQLLYSKPYTNQANLKEAIDNLKTDKIIKHILYNCLAVGNTKSKKLDINYLARNQNILQNQRGFNEDKYLGSKLNLYQKFNLKYNDFELFTVLDKDAGERRINDFTSYSFKYDDNNSTFILGDFNLSFGLGNLYDQSFLSLKGTDFINSSIEFDNRATMNRSTLEGNYFRGGYVDYSYNLISEYYLKIASFYSNSNRSANIDTSTSFATSIYQSGYFRTQTEIDKIGKLNEKLYGLNVEFSSNNFTVGIISTYLKYSNNISTSSFSNFNGKEGFLSSIFGNYTFEKNSIKFEISNDANNYYAIRINDLYNINENLSFLIDLRYSNPNYRAPYATNFGEQSFVANEKGLLTGFSYTKNKWDISLFVDYFSSMHRTFNTSHPIQGVQYFIDISKKFGDVDYGFRLSYEKKSDSFKSDSVNSKITQPNNKLRIRFDLNTNIGSGYLVRARTELAYNLNSYSNDYGNLILLEVKKHENSLNLYYGLSYTIFNTTTFESAIYGFQYQVPGLAYVYPYYLQGNNTSAFLKYSPMDYVDLWLRFNHFTKNDTDEIGSGYDAISGNLRTQLIIQAQFGIN